MILEKAFYSLKKALEKGVRTIGLESQSPSCTALFLSEYLSGSERPVVWICPDGEKAAERAKELGLYLPGLVYEFPSYEHLIFLPLIPAPVNAAGRIAALYNLVEKKGAIVVARASAVMERFIPQDQLLKNAEIVITEEEVDRQALIGWLVDTGYEHMTRVERVGEFSVRGEILDIFPPDHTRPVRLVFFDNLIEEIRVFDPETQRTKAFLNEVILLPCRELVYTDQNVSGAIERIIERAKGMDLAASEVNALIQNLEAKRDSENSLSILPLLYDKLEDLVTLAPRDAIFVIEDPILCEKAVEEFHVRVSGSYHAQLGKHRLLADMNEYYLPPGQIGERLGSRVNLLLQPGQFIAKDVDTNQVFIKTPEADIRLDCDLTGVNTVAGGAFTKGPGPFSRVAERLNKWIDDAYRVVVYYQAEASLRRLSGLLGHYDIPYEDLGSIGEEKRQGGFALFHGLEPGLYLAKGFVAQGFSLPLEKLVAICDHELFAFKTTRRKKNKKIAPVSISEIREGDLVVHRDHGIGRYMGLLTMSANGVPGEFMSLEYRGGDRLYLPVDRLGLLQRYVGVEGRQPRLDKLGARAWPTRKQKVRKAIQEIAHELVELYAARKVSRGIAFSSPDEMYQQFESAFPYQETQDQLEAIRDILSDLTAEYPMDRLLCGDVGFGKTEVAMRAAFKAVQDGYQVAVLVPTTLLAEQHERTFKRRFQRFPVIIESISRFKSSSQQRQAVEGVRAGSVDILIGTHRLLQKDIAFKRLGLVIIDEEHRFGVRHKERLKLLARNVNCLTLTATPIPRTLQLSLLGIRDLSVLETAPEGRLSIKTFVAEYDDAIVREAIRRELDRQGQVFFVHNRVKGIHRIAEHVQRCAPEAVVEVAHGQMAASELEDIMVRFVRGDIDCLVCTTIIESGLDIPSANTLIVNRADRLGMADLYQLRGRIGRGSKQAYAYLLVPRLESLGKDAAARLRAVMETSHLGSGMSLAMHDLKIRGAGNILGIAQAGQIAEVGYDLYLDLLKEAIDEIKGGAQPERIEPEVNLQVPAFIPADYVDDVHERLELYRHLGSIEDETDEEAQALDMEDRFGPLPQEVINLLRIMRIKEVCRRLNCTRLDGIFSGKSMLILTFGSSGPTDPDALLNELKRSSNYHLLSGQRLGIDMKGDFSDHGTILNETLRMLNNILELDKSKK